MRGRKELDESRVKESGDQKIEFEIERKKMGRDREKS